MLDQKRKEQDIDETRREFLRKSIYAAYATPVITALLVSEVSAAKSIHNIKECRAAGGQWRPIPKPGCCDITPTDGCGDKFNK